MKKITVFPIILFCSMMAFTTLIGCDQSVTNEQAAEATFVEKTADEQQAEVTSGEVWLKGIFSQCKSGSGYCIPDHKNIFTKQYNEFWEESYKIFEYPDFETEDELAAAETAYKNKWKNIYPLDKEIWTPFGMGNGMDVGDTLENISITRISDMEYSVLVEYPDGNIFSNKVLLTPTKNAFLIDFIDTKFKEEKAIPIKFSDPGIDNILPVFMNNKANTNLYAQASTNSDIVSTLPDEDFFLLIGLTAIKDKENRTWYQCYYPKEQLQGWTRQVSHWGFNDDQKLLPLLQNLTLANLQLGANPDDAKRLLGKPLSEIVEKGPMEISGFIDADYIVTTTTMQYDGIELTYQDDQMIHAEISKQGRSFGWIIIGDKKWNKDFVMNKFELTDEDYYDNNQGIKVITISKDILSLSIYLDVNDVVKNITWHYGS